MVAVVNETAIHDVEGAIAEVWDRVAFMTRYGKATLTEALCELDRVDAADYIAAIGRIVQQENATPQR